MRERIRLQGLMGSHPLGALASFGLLRLAAEWDSAVRLVFTQEDDWVACIQSETLDSIDRLIAKLVGWINTDAPDRALGWATDDVRLSPEDYRGTLAAILASYDLASLGFVCSMVADGAEDAQKGLVKPGAFYMVSGQQSFLKGARDIVRAVRADADSLFREALVGPWVYATKLHGLGWDPNTERLHALRHRAPTSEKPSCVAAAIVLALWALPLYPALSQEGRAFTIGFRRISGEQRFSWPLVSTPADLSELTSLIHGGERAWMSASGTLRPGIGACYESRRFEFGQGYAVFRAAQMMLQHGNR